ncbi:MAG: FAD-dependent oxidoreductase [Methanosarcina sp.]|nr:FAD-dependent oxidoreductase [Methanosarcina sp.]MDD3873806.1 FAD-dependent oxidoreductase [Methanosarcina sp.]
MVKDMADNKETDYTLPGKAESYWMATTPESRYPPLPGDTCVDVAILGGGMVGITTAYLLKEAGVPSVAVIEADRIITGVTGRTTAKVTSQHSLIYDHLISKFGKEHAQHYAESNQAAVEKIASIVSSKDIACDFVRKPAYVYAGSEESAGNIRNEVDAAKNLGLPASYKADLPLPFETYGAVCFSNQVQFHPRKYLCALAREIEGDGCHIFEKTRALKVEGDGPITIKTDKGNIKAQKVIQATHFPIHDKPGLLFQRLYQSRSYVLGVRIQEPFPQGMFINAEEPVRSLRSQPAQGGELILISGEGHRTGEGNEIEHYRNLEKWVRSVYSVNSIDYHWSTQDVITVDHVPYIGRLTSDNENLYIATGFRKWGMTTGTVAAMILTDMILGRSNPWEEVYKPSRFKPIESAKTFFSQAAEATKELVGDRITPVHEKASQILPGEGAIVKIEGKRVAAYRDKAGILHTLDPSCRHMGCIVSWNNAEKTWDCPCHGSRYSAEGEVIKSPVVYGLPEKKVKE